MSSPSRSSAAAYEGATDATRAENMVRLDRPSETRHQRPPLACSSVMPRPDRLIRCGRFGQTRLEFLHRRLRHEFDGQQQSAGSHDAGHLGQRLLLQGRAQPRQRVRGPCRIVGPRAKRERLGRPTHPVKLSPLHSTIDQLPRVAPGIDHDAPAVRNVMHRRLRQIAPITLDFEHAAGERKRREQTGALEQPLSPQPPKPVHRYRNHRPRLSPSRNTASLIAPAPSPWHPSIGNTRA